MWYKSFTNTDTIFLEISYYCKALSFFIVLYDEDYSEIYFTKFISNILFNDNLFILFFQLFLFTTDDLNWWFIPLKFFINDDFNA